MLVLTHSDVTMLSLTTYQDGNFSIIEKGHSVDIPESFKILKESWKKLSMLIRNRIRNNIDYFWVFEPHMKHDTGYPHLHILLFTEFTPQEQERIRNLWYSKYQAGSYEYGVDFTIVQPEEAIKNIRNYLMKYLAKTFVKTGSKFDDSPDWTKGQLVFNTITWDKAYRLWGSSRNLTKIMQRPPKESEKIEWYKIELCGCDEPIKIWQVEPDKMEIMKNSFENYLDSLENLKFI